MPQRTPHDAAAAAIEAAKADLRREVSTELTTVGVQIGAVERVLGERLETLKWRMIAALLGGQVLAGAVAALIGRTAPVQAREAVELMARFLT